METRIGLQGSIDQYRPNNRVYLSRAERSIIDWAMVDDHHAILELSCEHDSLIKYYQSQYHIRACGLCFDVELARKLRSLLANAEIMPSINGDIPWQNNSFDRIILINTLPFYLTFKDFLTEIFRVLKPSGKLVFALPSLKLESVFPSFQNDKAAWTQYLLELEKAGFKDATCNRSRLIQRCLIAYK